MAFNPNLKMSSLFGLSGTDNSDSEESGNKLMTYSDKVKQLINPIVNNQYTENNSLISKQNISSLLGENGSSSANRGNKSIIDRLNPFIDQSGNLKNRSLNYQSLLDRSETPEQTKRWIKQATGLEETTASGDTANQNTDSVNLNSGKHGFISAKYETGGWDPGLVSSGAGDYGGISYGLPQFSTTTGSAASFVNWLKKTYPEMGSAFGNASPGTSEFGNAWKETYSKYGDKFANAQTTYAYNTLVKPLVDLAKQKTGIDYTSSDALFELIYSTAIQFGGGSLGLSALGDVSNGMSERDIINASYDKKINNVGSFFRSSSGDVQNSVKNRFEQERNDVLALAG